MNDSEKNPFLDIKEQITGYVQLQAQVGKLVAYEKISKVSAALASTMVLMFLLFFALLFIFLSAAFYLGELLSSNALGFGLVALMYVLLIAVFMMVRKKHFEKRVTNTVVTILTSDDTGN